MWLLLAPPKKRLQCRHHVTWNQDFRRKGTIKCSGWGMQRPVVWFLVLRVSYGDLSSVQTRNSNVPYKVDLRFINMHGWQVFHNHVYTTKCCVKEEPCMGTVGPGTCTCCVKEELCMGTVGPGTSTCYFLQAFKYLLEVVALVWWHIRNSI